MASPPDPQRLRHERAIDALLWGLAASSAALTLWLSLGPVPPGTGAFPGADKVFHGLAYFVTTLLFLFAAVWRPGRGPGPLARFAPALIVAIVCSGFVVELMQQVLTETRELEVADWLADAAGALAAAALHALIRRLGAGMRLEHQRQSAASD
jgi:VanZ family protein